MASCAQCRLSDRKKKCTPDPREWPGQLCDYCVKMGYPCSRPMSKKQLESISDTERDMLLKKEQLRSADEIISDLDCLLYLQNEAQTLLERSRFESAGRNVDHPRIIPILRVVKLLENAVLRIGDVIAQVRCEADNTIDRLIRTGNGPKAYILACISSHQISYRRDDILREYNGQHLAEGRSKHTQMTLDASVGFYFRRLTGLELMCSKNFGGGKSQLPRISRTDIFYLYTTLDRVARICDEDFKHDLELECDDFMTKVSGSKGYIFRKLSPLSFTTLSLGIDQGQMKDFADWSQVVSEIDMEHLSEYSVEAQFTMGVAGYYSETNKFLEVISNTRISHYHHILDLDFINYRSGLVHMHDTLLRLAILHRNLNIFQSLFGIYQYTGAKRISSGLPVNYYWKLAKLWKPKAVVRVPLTTFMVAIICMDNRFIDPFLSPDNLHLWISSGSTGILLENFLDEKFAQDKHIAGTILQPIHLAGLTGQNELFRTLFEHHKKDYSALWTVAIAAVHNNDSSLFPLLTRVFEAVPKARYPGSFYLVEFIKLYGTGKLVDALLEFINSLESLADLHIRIQTFAKTNNPLCYSQQKLLFQNSLLGLEIVSADATAGRSRFASTGPDEFGEDLEVESDKVLEDITAMKGVLYSRGIYLSPAHVESYEAEVIQPYKSQKRKEGAKTCATVVTAVTELTKTSSTVSSEKSAISIGGMTLLVPSSRRAITPRKRKWAPENDIMEVDHED